MKKVGWSPNPNQKTYEIRPDALKEFGCLSEYIQVKGAIALSEISRTPIHIDLEKRARLEKEARRRYSNNMDTLIALEPRLFKRYSPKARNGKGGQIRYNKKTRLPEMSNTVLKEKLAVIAKDLNVDPPISKGIQENISLSAKDWLPIAEVAKATDSDSVKFLKAWCGLGSEVKLMSFLLALKSDTGLVYSNYNLLMRTGRTSASAHKRQKTLLVSSFNIQQMPREDESHPERSVRTLFSAGKDYEWGSFDYSYIELCTLASICKGRFGYSKLGEVIREHRTVKNALDPHQRTALATADMTKEQFLALPKNEQKLLRQQAKACSFGFPGGLGIEKFVGYAKANYGVSFTSKQAKEAKKKWMAAYPELKLYLSDPSELAMKWQTDLRTAPQLNYLQRIRLSQYLKMTEREREQMNYSERELDGFWEILSWIAKYKDDDQLQQDCKERKVTGKVRSLTTFRACTPTGRVRNYTTFTAGANTPFQGLNADACKLTMWSLMRKGIKILAYIHDSFEIAIPKGKEKQYAETVTKIMVKTMESVLQQDIPVGVEYAIADRWVK
jgi:hypothetical protein